MPYYVYIMTNPNHTVLYTGVTGNIARRIYLHKEKKIEGFTKRYNVTKLVYAAELPTAIEAITAEKKIKGWTRKKKVALIDQMNPTWEDLPTT